MDHDLLGALPGRLGTVTRQISAENPTGAKGAACLRAPDATDPDLAHSHLARHLGRGWKVRPFVRLPARRTLAIADIGGPGVIRQLFLTSDLPHWRQLVLRIWWDDAEHPSVEVPLGDFFAMGHDVHPHTVSSLPITVGPHRGCNSYWQMPFRRRARVELENQGESDANIVAYRVLWHECDVPADAGYFHAQWRRSLTRREHPEHVILDGVEGRGLYVGTALSWTALSRGWWGEGEVRFWIDGDRDPSLADNGTEDYFGGAWCFWRNEGPHPRLEREFSTPYLGMPLARIDDLAGPRFFSLYRWHLHDAIGFQRDLKVAVQALGAFLPDGTYIPLADDVASVAYWYQQAPHRPFPPLPPLAQRWSR